MEIVTAVLPQEILDQEWVLISPSYYDHPLEKVPHPDGQGFHYFRKKAHPEQVYRLQARTLLWFCLKCKSAILSARITHTVRDELFPCSGGGEVEGETVPYCPVCENAPSYHGSTVSVKDIGI